MAAKAGSKPPKLTVVGDGSPSPEAPGTAHNRGPLTADEMEDLFLCHLRQARTDNKALEDAMAVVKRIRKTRNEHRAACRGDGFPLAQLDELMADEDLIPSNVEERENKRQMMRRAAGSPGATEQLQLFNDSFEEADRLTKRWGDHGYNAGLKGLDQDPKKYEVPTDQIPNWMTRYGEGQERIGRAWHTKSKLEGIDIPDDIPKWTPPEEAAAEAPAPESEPA